MNEAVLAVVAMVLLLGVVAFGVGHKGWSWGTVIAGVLVILTAPGYLYLALRVVERERVWREKIVKLQNSIVQVRDAMVADQTGPKKGILKLDGKEQSIVSLGLQQARWQRAVQRVNTWRNRHWDNAAFGPPRNDKAGTLTLPFPNDAADTSPINEGAELAVFDNTAVENGGRFLGIFQVTDIQTDAEKKSHTLTVRSATQPDNIDEKLWSKNYDTVSIYEDLPVDRWLAFYATTQSADETTDTLLIPEPQKNQGSADEMLKSLETQLESFHKHEEVVEESAWKQLAEEKDKRLIPLGEYWASVVFKEPHELILKELRDPADQSPENDASKPETNATTKQFETDQKAEFDLETALGLGEAVEIIKVVYRRPLSDAFTALRGSDIYLAGDDEKKIRADGMIVLRKILIDEISAMKQAIAQLQSSEANTKNQLAVFTTEKQRLTDDLAKWQQDTDAAGATAVAFQKRVDISQQSLDTVQVAVVSLGKELTETINQLVTEINRQAPAPIQPAAPRGTTVAP